MHLRWSRHCCVRWSKVRRHSIPGHLEAQPLEDLDQPAMAWESGRPGWALLARRSSCRVLGSVVREEGREGEDCVRMKITGLLADEGVIAVSFDPLAGRRLHPSHSSDAQVSSSEAVPTSFESLSHSRRRGRSPRCLLICKPLGSAAICREAMFASRDSSSGKPRRRVCFCIGKAGRLTHRACGEGCRSGLRDGAQQYHGHREYQRAFSASEHCRALA